MKPVAQLIQENIERFQLNCKVLDKKLIEGAELLDFRKQGIEAHSSVSNSLDTTINYIKS